MTAQHWPGDVGGGQVGLLKENAELRARIAELELRGAPPKGPVILAARRPVSKPKASVAELKKRIEAVEPGRDESRTAFIELPSVQASVPECVIELENSAGILRVHLKGYSATEVATVGRSMRGSQ